MFRIKGRYNTAEVFQEKDWVEPSCIDQIKLLMNQPFVEGEDIRIMPDCHTGKGVCIGYTQTLRNRKVCPSLVGVDIGCGVLVVKLGSEIGSFPDLDRIIREKIPSSTNVHKTHTTEIDFSAYRCGEYLENRERLLCSIGTLGGGNHFIEVNVDEEGNYYLAIHTGSRNLGLQVAEYYQKVAYEKLKTANSMAIDVKAVIDDYKARGLEKEISAKLKELKAKCVEEPILLKEYAYLEGKDFDNYIHQPTHGASPGVWGGLTASSVSNRSG